MDLETYMNEKKILEQFCHAHNIKIVDTNKRVQKYYKPTLDYFYDPSDYNRIREHVVLDTEQLYTVEISESELLKISSFENQVFNHMRQAGHYDMFNYIMEQKEREKQLVNKYSAVKKAYEHYSLMLKMAESGEL